MKRLEGSESYAITKISKSNLLCKKWFRGDQLRRLRSLLGMILLWLTSIIPQAGPGPCDPRAEASKPTS